jgi:hypothetical protein
MDYNRKVTSKGKTYDPIRDFDAILLQSNIPDSSNKLDVVALESSTSKRDMFGDYVLGLADGLGGQTKNDFMKQCYDYASFRKLNYKMESETAIAVTPYEKLALPILRVAFPKLIMKDLFTTFPAGGPTPIMTFLRAYAYVNGQPKKLPNYDGNVSKSNVVFSYALNTGNAWSVNLFSGASGLPDLSSIESRYRRIGRPFTVSSIVLNDNTGTPRVVTINTGINPDANNKFFYKTSVSQKKDGGTGATITFSILVSGGFDNTGGDVTITGQVLGVTGDDDPSKTWTVASITFSTVLDQAMNSSSNRITMREEKIDIPVEIRETIADWDKASEQDMSILYDMDLQKLFVETMGEQVYLDTDFYGINTLKSFLDIDKAANPTSSRFQSFTKEPPSTYTLGPKPWLENMIVKLNLISEAVRYDMAVGKANVIGINTVDSAYLASMGLFTYKGNQMNAGGVVTEVQVGQIANGSWDVFASPIVPEGSVMVGLKHPEPKFATAVYAPYIVSTYSPWPLGRIPSLSFFSRFGITIPRPEGWGIMSLT